MHYQLGFSSSYEQWIDVRIDTQLTQAEASFRLPFWRPGRYEKQPYARFITDVQAKTAEGHTLSVEKTDSHTWCVTAKPGTRLQLSYRFYANQTDAGGSYLDENSIYVNGINLFLFQPGKEGESCTLGMDLPEGYVLGGGLPEAEGGIYAFADFHQLVDTPFMASAKLQHHSFDVAGILTHLWFMGECKPDWQRIRQDFLSYSEAQMKLFGEFPVQEYHYLFLMLPHQYRHGVEHHNSTVIVMGPGYQLMETSFYQSFLEISSHELFHTWNVKALRPRDMFPYDYSGPNYSKLHYVTEGVTTYYGDLMLWKSGIWDLNQWVSSINGELRTQFSKGGRDLISLEAASFDSWVNGYQSTGAPNRKISFYTKGYLVAMLLDWTIRQASEGQYSLDDVMYKLYHQVAKNGRGYGREDYQGIAEDLAGIPLESFFEQYIVGTTTLVPALRQLGKAVGLQLVELDPPVPAVARWGMLLTTHEQTTTVIDNLYPDSPAFAAGLSIGDELVAIQGQKVAGNARDLIAYFAEEDSLTLHVFHHGKLKEVSLQKETDFQWQIPQFFIRGDMDTDQRQRLQAWQSVGGANNPLILPQSN